MKKSLSLFLATIMMVSALTVMTVSAEPSTGSTNVIPSSEETVGYDPGRVLEASGLTEKVTASTEGVIQMPDNDTDGNSFVLVENGKYVISTAAQLKQFGRILRVTANKANHKNFAGATVYITAPIDCSELTLTGANDILGIGKSNTDCYFAGTLDGQGYAISNWGIEHTWQGAGFINRAYDATVKNVVLYNVDVTATQYQIGGLIGTVYGTKPTVVDNCMVISDLKSTASSTDNAEGGIVGLVGAGGLKISNCTFGGSISAQNKVGGILGRSAVSGVTITNCLNAGTVEATTTSTGIDDCSAGGILGYIQKVTVNINGCVNMGTVKAVKNAGTFVGTVAKSNENKADTVLKIENSYNYGTVSTTERETTVHHNRSRSRIYGVCFISEKTGASLTIDGVRYYGAYGPTKSLTSADYSTLNESLIYTGIPSMDLSYTADGELRVGGSIRKSPTLAAGLRFVSVIPAAMISAVKEEADEGTAVSFGTIIAPADYVSDGMLLTVSALKAADKTWLDIKGDIGMETDESGNVTLKAAMTEIKTENLNRDFLSVAYISYVKNGQTVYKYVHQIDERSAYKVATLALQAEGDLDEAEKAFVKKAYIDAYDELS